VAFTKETGLTSRVGPKYTRPFTQNFLGNQRKTGETGEGIKNKTGRGREKIYHLGKVLDREESQPTEKTTMGLLLKRGSKKSD